MAKFAVLGHGVVGSGTVELFLKNKEQINKNPTLILTSSTFLISGISPDFPIPTSSPRISTIS